MGQILHSCAKTTKAVRQAIQNSQESINRLAERYSINPKTVVKWKKRTYTCDAKMGPKVCRSSVLSVEEEAAIVTFRKHTLLPLDDCLDASQETIPHLSRSSLHRCLQRHGINKLPQFSSCASQPNKKFNSYPIGYFHLDIAEVKTEEGKLYLFVAIDRTSKFTYLELQKTMTKSVTIMFVHNLIKAVPYKIHTILTNNGIQFTNRTQDKHAFIHPFDRLCITHQIKHRLTKVAHPWTNGQVERMNRTLKEATIKKYQYQEHQTLKEHLQHFIMAYNYAKRLKALRGLTPYQYILSIFTQNPALFIIDPYQHTLGLNTALSQYLDLILVVSSL